MSTWPSSPEAAARRRRQTMWVILVAVLAALALLAVRPLYRIGKSWRARTLAGEAEGLMAKGQWKEAHGNVQAAYQLAPHEPAAQRAAARFYSRVGSTVAQGYWRALLASPKATLEDSREAAQAALRSRQVEFAEEQVTRLRQQEPERLETIELGAQLALLKGDRPAALEETRRLLQRNPHDGKAVLLQAQLFLTSPEATEQERGRAELFALTTHDEPTALPALEILARDPHLSGEEISRVAEALLADPEARLEHRLLAASLRARLQPEQRSALVEKTIAQEAVTSPEEKAQLGRWIAQQNLPARVLDLISPTEALAHQELFLIRMDALASLGRWAELQAILEKEKAPVEPMVTEIFLARAATELGEDRSAEGHWLAALAAATTPTQNLYLAQYAERVRNARVAIRAWGQLARHPAWSLKGQLALLPLLQSAGDTRALRDAMREVTRLQPKDPAPRNDLTYLNLLLQEEIPTARATAQSLFEAEPSVLAYRTTLALAYLRTGAMELARPLYEGVEVDWKKTAARFQAVRAATLGLPPEGLELDRLLPEERALLEPR